MDGSSASLIVIPIVVTLSLAAWLILVAYAAGHPQWKRQGAAAGFPEPAAVPDREPLGAGSPALAGTPSAGPVRDLGLPSASEDNAPDEHAGLAAAA
jgi:hypothetical protein